MFWERPHSISEGSGHSGVGQLFVCNLIEQQVPPLRYASVGMTIQWVIEKTADPSASPPADFLLKAVALLNIVRLSNKKQGAQGLYSPRVRTTHSN
jgi:hypothetical protein